MQNCEMAAIVLYDFHDSLYICLNDWVKLKFTCVQMCDLTSYFEVVDQIVTTQPQSVF